MIYWNTDIWVSHCACSMGFLKNAQAFLRLLQTVLEITNYRFILFTAGYIPLDAAIRAVAAESSPYATHKQFNDECISLFNDRLFCFSGWAPRIYKNIKWAFFLLKLVMFVNVYWQTYLETITLWGYLERKKYVSYFKTKIKKIKKLCKKLLVWPSHSDLLPPECVCDSKITFFSLNMLHVVTVL